MGARNFDLTSRQAREMGFDPVIGRRKYGRLFIVWLTWFLGIGRLSDVVEPTVGMWGTFVLSVPTAYLWLVGGREWAVRYPPTMYQAWRYRLIDYVYQMQRDRLVEEALRATDEPE